MRVKKREGESMCVRVCVFAGTEILSMRTQNSCERGHLLLKRNIVPFSHARTLIRRMLMCGRTRGAYVCAGEAGKFKVTVAERRSDPRSSAQASKRSYSLGLGE